jgi:hypothetical protein
MAKVRFDTSAATANAFKLLEKVKKDKTVMKEIGEFGVGRLKGQGKLGKPLNRSKKFKSLRPGSKAARRAMARFNKTDPVFNADKSNVTFTGQLWDGLTFIVKKAGVVQYLFKGSRKPYRKKDGSPVKQNAISSDNARLVKELIKLGFIPFDKKGIESDPKFLKRVNAIITRALRRVLRAQNR